MKYLIGLVVIAIAVNIFIFSRKDNSDGDQNSSASYTPVNTPSSPSNVSVVDGKQIITITAKGGYSPRTTKAKAGMPTVINMKTQGTFDCSIALSIPSVGYQNNLPPTGETMIDIPTQEKGSVIKGTCSMGMYNFAIQFE